MFPAGGSVPVRRQWVRIERRRSGLRDGRRVLRQAHAPQDAPRHLGFLACPALARPRRNRLGNPGTWPTSPSAAARSPPNQCSHAPCAFAVDLRRYGSRCALMGETQMRGCGVDPRSPRGSAAAHSAEVVTSGAAVVVHHHVRTVSLMQSADCASSRRRDRPRARRLVRAGFCRARCLPRASWQRALRLARVTQPARCCAAPGRAAGPRRSACKLAIPVPLTRSRSRCTLARCVSRLPNPSASCGPRFAAAAWALSSEGKFPWAAATSRISWRRRGGW